MEIWAIWVSGRFVALKMAEGQVKTFIWLAVLAILIGDLLKSLLYMYDLSVRASKFTRMTWHQGLAISINPSSTGGRGHNVQPQRFEIELCIFLNFS